MTYIYICHHKPNANRLSYLKKALSLSPFSVRFVTVGLPGDENRRFNQIKQDVDSLSHIYSDICHVSADIFAACQEAVAHNQGLLDVEIYTKSLIALRYSGWPNKDCIHFLPAWLRSRKLSNSEISINLKHRYALSKLLQCQHEDSAIIVEDDIIFHSDSFSLLRSIVNKVQSLSLHCAGPVYIDIGGGCGLHAHGVEYVHCTHNHIPSVRNQRIKLTQPVLPTSRTMCAYIVNKKFAEAFFKLLPSPCAPIDFEITYCMNMMKSILCFWLDPPIVGHGSQNGSYTRSIQ